MKYCSHCGAENRLLIPQGDNRERSVCSQCGIIHYQNPNIVCGVLPIYGDKVLLCKRAIEPRHGFWTLPAGFMENGETLEQGAARECWEEACATLENMTLYSIFNLPSINQVYILFKAEVVNGEHGAGEESLESRLYLEEEIPWKELAFPTISITLEHFFKDRKAGKFPLHMEDLIYKKKN